MFVDVWKTGCVVLWTIVLKFVDQIGQFDIS